EVNVMDLVPRFFFHPLLQGDNTRMQSQLQNGVDTFPCFFFNFFQGIHIPWIQYERFFTNRVSAVTKCKPDVRVVKVIRCTNANIINPRSLPSQLVQMAVETLELGKKVCVRKVGIENPYLIELVKRSYQVVARIPNGTKVPRGDESSYTD